MLRSLKDLHGYSIRATDGVIGDVDAFLFDSHEWTVRYMVVDTGHWLPGRKVLIAPASLGEPDWAAQWLPVTLTRKQVRESPEIDVEKPVSRRHERRLRDHYGWPHYWRANREDITADEERPEGGPTSGDPALRSTGEVIGYHIKAADGKIGHVDDFIVDDSAWVIRYMVVDTRNWLPGRKVLISPAWVEGVSWGTAEVEVNLTKEAIKNSPEFDASEPINREYEERLFDYYGRPSYWV